MNKTNARMALLAAAAIGVSACGGGGGGGGAKPPVTLNGVSFWAPNGQNSNFVIRESEGGTGANFGDVIYVRDDFGGEILSQQTGSTATTKTFSVDGNNFAVLAVPGGDTGFANIRFMRLVYRDGGTTYGSLGVIGRFTTFAQMDAVTTGVASYAGLGTALVRGLDTTNGDFQLLGDVDVVVNFTGPRAGSVTVTISGLADAPGDTFTYVPFDSVTISGAMISDNRFSGGTLVFRDGTSVVYGTDAPGTSRANGGIFAGWNDGSPGNGTNRPAEVGGAFTASTTQGVASGYYAAD